MDRLIILMSILVVTMATGCSTFNTATGAGNFVGKDAVTVYSLGVAEAVCRDGAGNRTPCSMVASTTNGSSTISVTNGGYYGYGGTGYMGGGYVNGIPVSAYSTDPYQPVQPVTYQAVSASGVAPTESPPAATSEPQAERAASSGVIDDVKRRLGWLEHKQDTFEDATVEAVNALDHKIDEK